MDSRIKRIEWIDNAKGICMIAVIFSHVLLKPISATPFYTPWFLTGFFFISGFLFFNPDKTMDVKQKYMNILTSILLPYISYWFISFAVDQILKKNYLFIDDWLVNVIGGGISYGLLLPC